MKSLLILLLLLSSLAMAQTRPRPAPARLATASRPAPKAAPVVNRLVSWHSYQRDTVRLLWMPVRASNWLWFNQYGYQIDRAEVVAGEPGTFTRITAAPVLPAPASQLTGPAREAMNPTDQPQRRADSGDSTGSDEANNQALRHLMVTMTAFESPETARRLGWADVTAQRGKTYAYRIFPLLPSAQHQPGDTTYLTVPTNRPTATLPPPQLEAESHERAVTLAWPAQALARRFVLYHIERSDDGRTFRRLSRVPLLHASDNVPTMAYRDSVPENYRSYAYRLVGMTPFGEWLISPYVVRGMGRDLTPPVAPLIEAALHLGGSRIRLAWQQRPTGDLRGFYISRGSSLRGSYRKLLLTNARPLLGPTERTYTDLDADPAGQNHYMVVAVDTAGNESPSPSAYVPLTDSLPPAAPTGLVARIDTGRGLGYVTLRWRRNPETDVQGYKVFFAHDPTRPFSQRAHRTLSDTVFRDTIVLRTLTKQVFYRVVALDYHYNHSAFSGTLPVTRPDVVRPAVPLITSVLGRESEIEVRWQTSPSLDVAAYRLLRRTGGSEWALVQIFREADLPTRQYTDKAVREGERYEYAVQVVDQSGLESEQSPGYVGQVVGAIYLPHIPTVQVRYDEARRVVRLTWITTAPAPYRVVIYRSRLTGRTEGPPLPIGTAEATQPDYIDALMPEGRYAYLAKIVLPSGQQSRLGPRTEVRIP